MRDYARPDGESGYFQLDFSVYGRGGEKCPGCICKVMETGGIKKVVQGGRSTFFCPIRQSGEE